MLMPYSIKYVFLNYLIHKLLTNWQSICLLFYSHPHIDYILQLDIIKLDGFKNSFIHIIKISE